MQVEGVVDRVRYHSRENGFTVFVLATEDGPLTCVGNFLDINPGEAYVLDGDLAIHPKFGAQFSVTSWTKKEPSTREQLVAYLSSGLFPHIGESRAQKLVDLYGEKTLETITDHPEALRKIRGIGKKRAEEIHQALLDQAANRASMIYLQSLDLGMKLASRILDKYGRNTEAIIRENPYRLAEDIEGVGFLTADKLARKLGVEEDSYFRTLAGLHYLFQTRMEEEGSSFWTGDRLEEELEKLLGLASSHLDEALEALEGQGRVHREGGPIPGPEDRWYPDWAYLAEQVIAGRLAILMEEDREDLVIDKTKVEGAMGLRLSGLQEEAVDRSAREPILVITGGPGTGKTTILRAILEVFDQNGLTSDLAAPTGRAAKRMEESTGRTASTIHRLLGFKGSEEGGVIPEYDGDNPLPLDALIVDEASMIDLSLMATLVRALPDGARLVLVGDVDQLPSVGAGNVLHDLIRSQVIPTIKLDRIYRQSKESLIVSNAHRIHHGQLPEVNDKEGDFFFLPTPTDRDAADLVEDLVARRLPQAYDWDPLRDIQVLSAMKKGVCGVEELNRRLQAALNPQGARSDHVTSGRDRSFWPGDKVMQVKNNYNLLWTDGGEVQGQGVYNGDFGFVEEVLPEGEGLVVDFEGRRVTYDLQTMGELDHAFAITIHKAQGSEFPCLVLPMVAGPPFFLTRNLLYTAITRARKLCILVGSRRIMESMIKNDRSDARQTSLDRAIIASMERGSPFDF